MRNAFVLAAALILGCGNDRVTGGDDVEDDFVAPQPPAIYVAKVKNILVGLPPTADEVRAVEDDPAALKTLIDGWMQLPEYQQKMMVFFQLAFQQTQLLPSSFVDMLPNQGLLNGSGVSLLTQNATESIARTALQLETEGRPLTEAFTTKRVMMTPALMSLYALLDVRTLDNTGRVRDAFAQANPGVITMRTAGGPIPLAQSVNPNSPNFMKFYTPDLPNLNYQGTVCDGLDPISFNRQALPLFQMLLGTVPTHDAPDGTNCNNRAAPNTMQFSAADFTTWKMVTVRAPIGNEQVTQFYDIPKLRSANELVLRTPRTGFFSTPAFFANWPSNASNQHRVTLNQALIVATGAQVDGTDPTVPATTPGMDTDHAQGGCVACHQLLDPTRSIFSSTYSWFGFPATDAQLMAQPGQFAFQNVIAPMTTIDDFGQLLATHPLVAEAWTQKLCHYANSAPCDPADPETVRIVAAFKASGFAWKTLVRDLLSSPITTHATATIPRTEVIAVARRDHLCAAMDRRLGLADVCQLDATLPRRPLTKVGQIVAGLPSDGYGRGSTTPVLPNDPTLFYRAGLENICGELAVMTVDGEPDTAHPDKRQWSSVDPDAAIADFVSTIMALTPADPRSKPATDALKAHFTAALATESPTDSLRSTFVVACLSPSFIGIGL
jgi:hypothetical protein